MIKNADEKEVMECLLGPRPQKYPEAVRSFAITLHFHSPRAYEYLREKFNKNLPHVSTIRKWFANSNSNGEPGINQQTIKMLQQEAKEMETRGEKLVCVLSHDEMSIKKHIQWSDAHKKFLGNVTGSDDELKVANNVIVFMINGLNRKINTPVAFYFITSLNAAEKHALLHEIISEITKCGVELVGVTFDGLISNITACESLGASFAMDDFRPYFENPHDKSRILIFLDPPHMAKLGRNCIGSEATVYDADGNQIEWQYIEILERFRSEKNFQLTHKLTKRHMQWERSKMNVGLAVATLSNSVADSMQFLKDSGCDYYCHILTLIIKLRFLQLPF